MQVLTAPIAILFDALSFLVSVVTLASIKTREPPPHRAMRATGAAGEALDGLRFVLSDALLRAFLFGDGTRALFFGNFFGALYTLYAIRELQIVQWL